MSKRQWLVALIVVVVLIFGAAGLGYYKLVLHKGSNLRQAVFLTNGQVYFGYVDNPNSVVVKVSNIYYLKTQDLLQANTDPNQNANKKISLVKLGNELHGPTDTMLINRDQILFIEDMRDSSKVNQAIKKYSQTASAK